MHTDPHQNRVAIIGGSIAGCMAAAFIKKKQPDLDVVVISPEDFTLPIVGESTVEGSVSFLREIGLGDHLRDHHLPKYGLTFYYRLPSESGPPLYSAHESLEVPHTLSRLINRFVIDKELRKVCAAAGVRLISGRVNDATLSAADGHVIDYTTATGTEQLRARWMIDASGRQRFLGKKLGLIEKPQTGQRSTYWFRLADFDRAALLRSVRIAKPAREPYDGYCVTHHFMGKGNWIWCIPLQCESGRELISVGITWRPDVFEGDVRNLEDFKRAVRREHPNVVEFVESGKVLDEQTYRKYIYWTKRVYSPDRWFVIGDAANAVDPLYSTGLLFTSLGVRQVCAMIRADREQALTDQDIEVMDTHYRGAVRGIQSRITSQYEVMDDAYQSHVLMHWDTLEYSHFFLPLLAKGISQNPKAVARLIANSDFAEREKHTQLREELLRSARQRKKTLGLGDIYYWYDRSLFYDFDYENCSAAELLSKGFRTRAMMRLQLLKDAGWSGMRRQLPEVMKDLGKSAALKLAGDRAFA